MPEPLAFLDCPACNYPNVLKVVWEYRRNGWTRGCACTMCGAQISIFIPAPKEHKRPSEGKQKKRR